MQEISQDIIFNSMKIMVYLKVMFTKEKIKLLKITRPIRKMPSLP